MGSWRNAASIEASPTFHTMRPMRVPVRRIFMTRNP
jgi:hypothetical protein